jgi:ADP-heptose:LPS heptosyltransferase
MTIKKTKYFLFVSLYKFFDLFVHFKNKRETSSGNKILFVRVDNIGDFILWLPYAEKLCIHFSEFGKQILVCNQSCVELANELGIFYKVIGIDTKKLSESFLYRLIILRKISALKVHTAVQPTFSRDFLTGDSIIKATRAKIKIGSIGDFSSINRLIKKISDRWYTYLVQASNFPMMELYRNAEFLNNIGMKNVYPELPKIPFLLNSPLDKNLEGNYFVIFPGASEKFKQWPVESFAKIVFTIFDDYGLFPVICGGSKELDLSYSLQNITKEINCINLVGRTSLPELIEVIRGGKLLVSNDTSAIHIAVAVSTPSVCILGGGHYGRFLPYPEEIKGIKPIPVYNKMDCFGCNWKCCLSENLTRPFPCIEGVNYSQVLSAVQEALKNLN